MAGLQIIGDYRYSGAVINGQKYSIVRNGDELVRVRMVFDREEGRLLWDSTMPMSLAVLAVLKHEVSRCSSRGNSPGKVAEDTK